MKKTVFASVAVLSAAALLTGCTGVSPQSAESTPTRSTVTVTTTITPSATKTTASVPSTTSSAPVQPATTTTGMTDADVLSLEIPPLCVFPGGKLVNGVLPDAIALQPSQNANGAIIPHVVRSETDGSLAAYGDFTGDGVDDALVEIHCNAGGVNWPSFLLAYSDGTLVQKIDLTQFSQARGPVTTREITGGRIHISGPALAAGDPQCCATSSFDAVYEYRNGQLVLVSSDSP